jgi:hypothetical protein
VGYAEREKMDELKRLAMGDTPLEEVTKIRSGYGTIKKIECMELFVNLRELLLCTHPHMQTTITSASSRASPPTSSSTSSPSPTTESKRPITSPISKS